MRKYNYGFSILFRKGKVHMQIVLKMCQSSEFDPRTDRLSLPETHCPCKRKDEKKDEDDRYVENSTSDIRPFQK